MLTLSEIKDALYIDMPDHDDFLLRALGAAIGRATSITGLSEDCLPTDVESAIIQDVGTMFTNRTDNGEIMGGSRASIFTYRRHSTKPMF
jgi:hypothetical protein